MNQLQRFSVQQDELSLKQAAELVGISKATLWRAVHRGEVAALQDDKGHYRLSLEALSKWRETFQGNTQTSSRNVSDAPGESFHAGSPETIHLVSSDLHRVALETTRQALESARRAEERAERAERLQMVLQGQLIQHQSILGERAESLLEVEARARQAELLAIENEQRLVEFTAERETLERELQSTRKRINWLEQRIPRWVRRCFGDRAG